MACVLVNRELSFERRHHLAGKQPDRGRRVVEAHVAEDHLGDHVVDARLALEVFDRAAGPSDTTLTPRGAAHATASAFGAPYQIGGCGRCSGLAVMTKSLK